MTTVVKFTQPGAAGVEVDARARRYVEEHQGVSYQEAVNAVLASDRQLAEAYAAPAPRRRASTMATTDARSQPAVPVTAKDERVIFDWVLRAVRDGKAGSLPGAAGSLSLEAAKLAKIGMPVEEAARRAMDSYPHLVTMAKLLLADVRRNAPESKPETAAAQVPGDVVHNRAQALIAKHQHMDYHEAMGAVLAEDPALKTSYARS